MTDLKIENKYEEATDILQNIWCNIDWDNIDKGRRMKIYSEFENQAKALSKCFSSLEPFITKLCARFNSFFYKKDLKKYLENDPNIYMNIFRYEIQIPMCLLRVRQDEKKENVKKYKEEIADLSHKKLKEKVENNKNISLPF